jgi:hypothetical protein
MVVEGKSRCGTRPFAVEDVAEVIEDLFGHL